MPTATKYGGRGGLDHYFEADGQRNERAGPAQPGFAVDGDAALGILGNLEEPLPDRNRWDRSIDEEKVCAMTVAGKQERVGSGAVRKGDIAILQPARPYAPCDRREVRRCNAYRGA